MSYGSLLFSLIVGILPPLLWLWFWLKEDRLHPEPRRLLILTFFAGMAVVAVALVLEQATHYVFEKLGLLTALGGFLILFFWALAEESMKYMAAKKVALSKKDFDEPIDALIYLITAALGFAALENVIFLVDIVTGYGFSAGFMTGNLRFVGATLIHLLSSATVGASIAFCFFHKESHRKNVIWGLFFATILHALFNFFIIRSDGNNVVQILLPFWFLIIVLLFVFEKVKKIKKK
ncbi:PrsW family intramembrane metalloprotease [Patescibacteria group bacterium]|nr:PrsW family intramembrane metalloprotease [Patescibacteria group bacterium]MBU2633062.1 PrsW family intramembrane metalloprotease [Patescibacteria group bacterium]